MTEPSLQQPPDTGQPAPQCCAICGTSYRFTWTDTHGVAACIECGLPYRLYHYDAQKNRIAKPPEIAIKESWVSVGKRYWEETHRRTFPAAYDFAGMRRGETSYSGATRGDCEAFDAWLDAHPELLPAKEPIDGGEEAVSA